MLPTDALTAADRQSAAREATAPQAAAWLANPDAAERRQPTLVDLWQAEPEWTGPDPEPDPEDEA